MNLTTAHEGKPRVNQHRRFDFFAVHAGILAWIAALIVWFPALFTYFSQDDFTHLLISRVDHWYEIWGFFVPVQTAIFYRPISIQLTTWLMRTLFGLQPFWFHLLALFVHTVNIWLVFKLLYRFIRNRKVAWLGAFIYGVHPVHFMSIFWVAEFSMVLAPFFSFLAIWFFLERRYSWFLLWMLLGLLSNELVVMVPLILATYFLWPGRDSVPDWKWLVPAAMLALGLLWLRFVMVPTSLGSEYVLSFSPSTWISNLRWQMLRSVGLPEGFRAYISWYKVQLGLAAWMLFWGIWLWSVRLKLVNLWGVVWYGLALTPVLLLLHHQSPIYQIVGLPGFILAILLLVKHNLKSNLKIATMAGLFFVSAFWSVRAMNDYHWVTKRARIAKYHTEKLRRHNPSPDSSVIFLNTEINSSEQVYLALAGDHGAKALFGNEIQSWFEDLDQEAYPKNAVFVLSRMESQMK